ncbi:hypothetical protein MBOT_29070 [Mycobacterium botniense]|uniref:Uncharacterized protein n=1 Tax=Mycobacterium botniense TaxID=84962 RepID=A0A7I9Y0E2_9MYCO|nr:hypothetical protein MBOT_29070 [Mycobacterium botniense]
MGDKGPCGVEHNSVTDGSLRAGQHRTCFCRVGFGVSAKQVVKLGPGETESGGIEGQPVHGAGLHPPDRACRGGGQLVESVVAVHHQNARTPGREHPRHHLGQIGERAADQPGPRLGRVRQWAKEIEDRRHPHFAPHRRCVRIGGVKSRGEAEPDPDFGDATGHLIGPQVDAHPEGLEGVSSPGKRGNRPVAVFDHRHTRRCRHDRRHRGHIDGVDAVAAGTDHVDGVGAGQAR